MILGWDFFLAHKAWVDAGRQLFVFGGRETPLLTREQVVPAPTLVRARERVVISARSEKVVVANLENIDCILDGYDIVVDPANVFGNDEGLAVAQTVTTATVGQCLVQVVNVIDSDVCLEAETPLGTRYHLNAPHLNLLSVCAVRFMYEMLEHHKTAGVEVCPTDRPGTADKGTPTDILGGTHGGSEIPSGYRSDRYRVDPTSVVPSERVVIRV